MTGRNVLIGICAVCALAISAFAAQGALAAGTTAFTCVENGGLKDFSDGHCKTSVTAGTGQYGHVAINPETSLTVEANETSFAAVVSGISVEFKAESAIGVGTQINEFLLGPGHLVNGTARLVYSNVEMVKPAGKECAVAGKEIETEPLDMTTANQGMGLRFSPALGTVLAEFEVTGCKGSKALEALNGAWSMTGSVAAEPQGATIVFTHAATTAQGTFKLRGQTAGIAGELELKNLSSGTPISFTTMP